MTQLQMRGMVLHTKKQFIRANSGTITRNFILNPYGVSHGHRSEIDEGLFRPMEGCINHIGLCHVTHHLDGMISNPICVVGTKKRAFDSTPGSLQGTLVS